MRQQLRHHRAALTMLAELIGRSRQRHLPADEGKALPFAAPGHLWPSCFRSAGLSSKRSSCEGAPIMCRKMTFFARGAKCGREATEISTAGRSRASSDPKAAAPESPAGALEKVAAVQVEEIRRRRMHGR